jgi:hypothetical protein
MKNVGVTIGESNGDGKTHVVLSYEGREYPDSVDLSSGFQRSKCIERALPALGLNATHVPMLDGELARQWKQRIAQTADENHIGNPVTVRLNTVNPEPIVWLWDRKIACGKVNLLVGDPGLGKSLVSLDWTAVVTTGRAWPDGSPNGSVGSVVLLSFEDHAGDTIRPRLDCAGADVSRVVLLQGVTTYDSECKNIVVRPFDLQRDMAALDRTVQEVGDCRMVVVDPISACLGRTDSHKNSEVRAVLTPLAEMAQRHHVAVVGVSHLNKSGGPAMYRAMGSLAFVAAARSVWVVTKDKQNPTNRLVLPLKNNLGPDQQGLAYRVVEVNGQPVLAWDPNPVTTTADEALAPEPTAGKGARQAKHQEVENWLHGMLENGPQTADEVRDRAKAAGYSDYNLKTAKNALGVVPYKEGFGRTGVWIWSLPGYESAKEGEF